MQGLLEGVVLLTAMGIYPVRKKALGICLAQGCKGLHQLSSAAAKFT